MSAQPETPRGFIRLYKLIIIFASGAVFRHLIGAYIRWADGV